MSAFEIDDYGRNALHYAAMENDEAGIDRLVDEGADVGLQDRDAVTPLHMAAEHHAREAAARLLAHGAPVDATNQHGNTPLFVATFNSKGRGELIELLLEFGADAARENKHGQTPRGLANLIGNYDVARFFGKGKES